MHADDYPTLEAVDDHLAEERGHLAAFHEHRDDLLAALRIVDDALVATDGLLDKLLDIRIQVASRVRV